MSGYKRKSVALKVLDQAIDTSNCTGLHWNTVSAIELGKSGGRPETLAAIKKALEKAGVEFTNGRKPGVRLWKR